MEHAVIRGFGEVSPAVSFVGLALAGSFLAAGSGHAQFSSRSQPQDLRLTVRPQTMATGTRNPDRSGYYLITPDLKTVSIPKKCAGRSGSLVLTRQCPQRDSLKHLDAPGAFIVYIPPPCMGTRRCPLLLYSNTYNVEKILADHYGLITVPIDAPYHVHIREGRNGNDEAREIVKTEVEMIDRRITVVLQNLAIDPAKIVILGGSATGLATVELSSQNTDVFSRALLHTQHVPFFLPMRTDQTIEYFIMGGLMETQQVEDVEHYLRDRGYSVKYVIRFGGHGISREGLHYMGQWLQESWAIPDPAARPVPYAFGEVPLLTSEIMNQMTAFWQWLTEAPDSIQKTGRVALSREVVVPIGTRRVLTRMVDMAALAARYPTVAAALARSGLTPQQHDAYRAALYGAMVASLASRQKAVRMEGPYFIPPMSKAARNLAFMEAHPREFEAFKATGTWTMP